jgi:hypothetical protein
MHTVVRPEEKTVPGRLVNIYGIILKRILNEYGDRGSTDYNCLRSVSKVE